MKKTLLIITAIVALLCSCQSDPSISVTPQTASVDTEGGTVNVTVTSGGIPPSASPSQPILPE